MKRIFQNFLGTVGLVVVLALLYVAAKVVTMIPLAQMLEVIKSNWIGILIGLALAYIGAILAEIFEKRPKMRKPRRNMSENDD